MKPNEKHTLFNPRPDLFFPNLDVASKEDLFATLVDALAERGITHNRDALLKTFLEREAIGTTAIAPGIAIPHARSMVVETTNMAFARLPNGVDFAARDGAPVRAVFLLVAPHGAAGALYLPLLAAIAAASHKAAARRRLFAVESFEDYARLMSQLTQSQLLEVRS